jgi:hypothetical protein
MVLRLEKPYLSSSLGKDRLGMRWLGWFSLLNVYAQSSLDLAYEAIERRLTLAAQRHLEAAMQEKDSLLRAEAALVRGILAFQTGRYRDALSNWYLASKLDSGGPIGAEANFHRAHLLLQSRSDWPSALYLLRTLIESSGTPPDLRAAVENRLRAFAYREADPGFLWAYLSQYPSTILTPYLAEALAYHLRQSCSWKPWYFLLHWYPQTCATSPISENIDSLLAALPPETLRIAVLLPFMTSQGGVGPVLNFWQGATWSLPHLRSPYAVWQIQLFDTERNPLTVRKILDSLTRRPPHLLVGDLSYSLNQIIADWCQRHQVWHAIPINKAYPRTAYTFPLNVPADCIGAWVGTHLSETQSGKRGIILIESDEPTALAYAEGVKRKHYAPTVLVPNTISAMLKRWNTLKDSLSSYDWYLLAITNEEVASFLLNRLGRDTLPLPLLIGMEDWLRFQRTELKDFWRITLWVPQTYLPDSSQWSLLVRWVRDSLGIVVTPFHLYGYEAFQLLGKLSAAYGPDQRPYLPEAWAGLINRYQIPPDCRTYRWVLWEYRRGTITKVAGQDGS